MAQHAIFVLLALAAAAVAGWFIMEQPKDISGTSSGSVVSQTETVAANIEKQAMADKEAMEKAAALLETAELGSTDARGGTALAARIWDGETFNHTVLAQVADPNPGKFYEGWLVVKGAVPANFFSTGAMTKNAEGMWELSYTATQDYPAYTFVVITEETSANGLDNKPEAHIFEGLFN